MQTSTLGKIQIAAEEGLCTGIYFDSVGVRTVGIGNTVTEIPNINQLPLDTKFTIPHLIDLFTKSLKKYEDAVNRAVKVKITQQQFDALVSFCYNVGGGALAKSSIIRDLNAGAPITQVANDFMRFLKPPELYTRRVREYELFLKGEYINAHGILEATDTNGHGKEINHRKFDISPYFAPQPVNTPPSAPTSTKTLKDWWDGVWQNWK